MSNLPDDVTVSQLGRALGEPLYDRVEGYARFLDDTLDYLEAAGCDDMDRATLHAMGAQEQYCNVASAADFAEWVREQ